MPTGTGQTSACGSMIKVGQAAYTTSINRCLKNKSLQQRRTMTGRGPGGAVSKIRLCQEGDSPAGSWRDSLTEIFDTSVLTCIY